MRRRLLLVTGATTVMVALAFLVPLAFLVREFARDRALDAAEREAQALGPVLALTDDSEPIELAIGATRSGAADRMTVFLHDGRTLGTTGEADDRVALARAGRSFSADTDGGVEVLAPVALPGRGTAVVRVFVPSSELDDGVAASWTVLGALAVALLLLALVVADRLARTVTSPVTDLASAAKRLGEGQLDIRVTPRGPDEIADLARAFNRTVERLRALVAGEREAVADLSHRLRTPLTALRLDAEALSDREAAARLTADVEALNRTVTELIEEARRPVRQAAGATCDAAAVARERAEFWRVLAEEQGRSLRVQIAATPLLVPLPTRDLVAALDALIGNVFTHTPDGTGFEVSAEREGSNAVLVVADEGPGLPTSGVTARGTSGGDSTGLGLDIARRTAEAAHGRLRLGEGPGARIEMVLPLT